MPFKFRLFKLVSSITSHDKSIAISWLKIQRCSKLHNMTNVGSIVHNNNNIHISLKIKLFLWFRSLTHLSVHTSQSLCGSHDAVFPWINIFSRDRHHVWSQSHFWFHTVVHLEVLLVPYTQQLSFQPFTWGHCREHEPAMQTTIIGLVLLIGGFV